MGKKNRFYDSDYWHSGEGQLLWALRRIQAFINEATKGVDVPAPWLTVHHKSDYDTQWVGWYACWQTRNNGQLEIEYEDGCFSVWAFTEDIEYVFYYAFYDEQLRGEDRDLDAVPANDPEGSPWSKLGEALEQSRAWLKDNQKNLVPSEKSFRSVFDLL
jgi:hypothetical protein